MNWKFLKWGIGIISLVFVTYTAALLWFSAPISLLSLEKSGQFGDSFGALTSIFTALGFLGIAYTIYLQNKQMKIQMDMLKNQQEELALTRDEIKGQKIEMDIQNRISRVQQFETTFFNMISNLNNNNLEIYKKNSLGEEQNHIDKVESLTESIIKEKDEEKIINTFYKISLYESKDTHWIATRISMIDQIIFFLDKNKTINEQFFYSNILRSNLTPIDTKILIASTLKNPKNPVNERYLHHNILAYAPVYKYPSNIVIIWNKKFENNKLPVITE